ncbi:MAG TPA: hypothetical protein VIP46_13330 [Pyrinomonadaceae bacterium]
MSVRPRPQRPRADAPAVDHVAQHALPDYSALSSRARGQFPPGRTPNPGTAFYVGNSDDLTRDGPNPFTGRLEPGFRRNGRTFFVRMSYLIRRSFGG